MLFVHCVNVKQHTSIVMSPCLSLFIYLSMQQGNINNKLTNNIYSLFKHYIAIAISSTSDSRGVTIVFQQYLVKSSIAGYFSLGIRDPVLVHNNIFPSSYRYMSLASLQVHVLCFPTGSPQLLTEIGRVEYATFRNEFLGGILPLAARSFVARVQQRCLQATMTTHMQWHHVNKNHLHNKTYRSLRVLSEDFCRQSLKRRNHLHNKPYRSLLEKF